MKKSKVSRRYENLLLLIVPLVFIIDRVIKIYAENGCLGQFCISRAVNDGAAFGILSGQTSLLITVGFIVLVLIVYIYKRSNQNIKLALMLIAAGTLSNLYDRLFYGAVFDVFSIFGSSSFNFADLSNVIGALILLKVLLKRK